jgi:tetratricopeptide (TPR) repeat protein
MKFYNILIKYRLWLGLTALVLGVVAQMTVDIWTGILLYTTAVIAIVTHFIIGPLRLVQKPMEEGNIEEVKRIIDSVWFPGLLIKPIRSSYYTLKANMDMASQDFASAEINLKKSASIGSAMAGETEGANKLQLGMLAMQRSDFKAGEKYVKEALKAGLPDKESEAMAHLAMVQAYLNRREFKAAKDFFRRAKACKPKAEQTVKQIKEMEKYLSRIPG